MLEQQEAGRAFGTFRALENDADVQEQSDLFRNMALLFAHVSDRCDDDQVEQYDDVLCKLAELVESEARGEVAKLLAPLERAPGTVIVKLANDEFEVAKPVLEFSSLLSDEDLVEIVSKQTEQHRVAIAGRKQVADSVGSAIVEHGQDSSVERLASNDGAELKEDTLGQMVERAAENDEIAAKLRRRSGIDWTQMHAKVSGAGQKVLGQLRAAQKAPDAKTVEKASAIAFNRIQNKAGFSGADWKIAWNQVKALQARNQLNASALARFTKFGYGHHVGAALTLMLGIKQEVFVKWLATNDVRGLSLACASVGVSPDIFLRIVEISPWRNSEAVAQGNEAEMAYSQARNCEPKATFALWRKYGFSKENLPTELHQALGLVH